MSEDKETLEKLLSVHKELSFFIHQYYRMGFTYTVKDVMAYSKLVTPAVILIYNINDQQANQNLPHFPAHIRSDIEKVQFISDVNDVNRYQLAEFATTVYNKIPEIENLIIQYKSKIEIENEQKTQQQ